jgi:Tfp pilus assembly PilM family ATPase
MSAFFGLDIGSNSVKLIELSGSSVTSIGIAANPTGRVGLDLVPAELSALSMVVKGLIDSIKLNHNVVVGVPEARYLLEY